MVVCRHDKGCSLAGAMKRRDADCCNRMSDERRSESLRLCSSLLTQAGIGSGAQERVVSSGGLTVTQKKETGHNRDSSGNRTDEDPRVSLHTPHCLKHPRI